MVSLWNYWTFLSGIVSSGLLCLKEMAATGIATASESMEITTSLSVSAVTLAFCLNETDLGGASTTLTMEFYSIVD